MNAQKDKILSYEREVTNNEGKITYSKLLLPSFDDEISNCTSNISKFTKLVNKYSNGFRKSLFKNKLAKYTSLLKNSIDNLNNIENKRFR